jgi:hypothetical protein
MDPGRAERAGVLGSVARALIAGSAEAAAAVGTGVAGATPDGDDGAAPTDELIPDELGVEAPSATTTSAAGGRPASSRVPMTEQAAAAQSVQAPRAETKVLECDMASLGDVQRTESLCRSAYAPR